MARKGGKRTAEMVVRLVQIGGKVLAESLGATPAQAELAMREIAHELCKEYGGQSMYVAKDSEFELQLRDQRLWEEFNGANLTELAVKYALSERQVGYVIAHMRRTEGARTQPRLPGLDD
jgi:Mor family transcriptional regulator